MKISKKQQQINRETVLNAAASLSESVDFSKVTYKDLAAETGLSQQVIYKYFPTKNIILKEFMNLKIFAAIAKDEEMAPETLDERFELFCLNFFEIIANHSRMLESILDAL